MTQDVQHTTRLDTRWLELAALFIGIPLILATALPPDMMWSVLILCGVVAGIWLYFTPNFRLRDLWSGQFVWRQNALLFGAAFIGGSILCALVLPERLWGILREAPYILPILAVFYPLILVLPQEVIFRPLFFKRYESLFKSRQQAILVNAALFSFAHLLYWNVIVLALTFIGSIIFSRAYFDQGFKQAWALHSVAGVAIFMSGLGWLFYTGGNIAQ